MNLTPITNEGTYFEVSVLPSPWPTSKEIVLRRRQGSDGELLITADASGRLKVAISKTDNTAPTLHLTSCPIAGPPRSYMIIEIVWRAATGDLDMLINGTVIGSLKSPDTVPVSYTWKLNQGTPPKERVDYSKLSVGAQTDRRNRWNNFKPHEDRVDGGIEHVRSEFRDSILVLADHLEAVRTGKRRFIKELASDLRTLLQASRPMPQLQMCAAADDKPLIVYTAPGPDFEIPAGTSFRLRLNAKAAPEGVWTNPIDLDVWLSQEAFRAGNVTLTHGKLIQEIGNTIGAHSDRDILPSVLNLRATKIQEFGVEIDMVQSYLMGLADMTIALAQPLLDQPE